MTRVTSVLLAGAMVVAAGGGRPAPASTSAAWAAADARARRACIAASGLIEARVSAPIPFSDAVGRTALLVTGRWPQRFMRGRRGTMLCLFDRRTGRAETSEARGWIAPPQAESGPS